MTQLNQAAGSPSRINTNQVSPADTVSRSMRLHMTAAFCARLCLAHVLFEQEDERQAASTGAHKARCCSIMSRFDNAVAQAQPRSLPLHHGGHALCDLLPDFRSLASPSLSFRFCCSQFELPLLPPIFKPDPQLSLSARVAPPHPADTPPPPPIPSWVGRAASHPPSR